MAQPDDRITRGRLAHNYSIVQGLWISLKRGVGSIRLVPDQVERVIDAGAWREWYNPDHDRNYGEGWGMAADIRAFIRKPSPEGCDTDPAAVLEILKDHPRVYGKFVAAYAGKPGGANNPSGSNQYKEVNTDIIRNDQNPDIIPLPRDRSNDMPGGTAIISAVRRLSKDRPELLERVKAGELSPHGAMVEAGFRPRSITIPDDPEKAAKRILRHFQGERLKALIDCLTR